jgi:hypothetical protein
MMTLNNHPLTQVEPESGNRLHFTVGEVGYLVPGDFLLPFVSQENSLDPT